MAGAGSITAMAKAAAVADIELFTSLPFGSNPARSWTFRASSRALRVTRIKD